MHKLSKDIYIKIIVYFEGSSPVELTHGHNGDLFVKGKVYKLSPQQSVKKIKYIETKVGKLINGVFVQGIILEEPIYYIESSVETDVYDLHSEIYGFDDNIVSNDYTSELNLTFTVDNTNHNKKNSLSLTVESNFEYELLHSQKTLHKHTFKLTDKFKGSSINTTKYKDMLIITTGDKIFVLKQFVYFKDGSPSDTKHLIIVEPIEKFVKKITTEEAIESGYNILSKNPTQYLLDEFGSIVDTKLSGIILNEVVPDINTNITFEGTAKFNDSLGNKITEDSIKTKYTWHWELKKKDKDKYSIDIPLENINSHSYLVRPDTKTLETGEYQIALELLDSKNVSLGKHKLIFEINKHKNKNTSVGNKHHSKDMFNEINSCKYVMSVYDKLIFYGNGTQQIYTSMINDPFYFVADNVVVADTYNKKEEIVRIETYKDVQLIFTESTIMSMSGRGNFFAGDAWKVLPLDGVVGAVDHNAVSQIENTIAFVSRDSIYLVKQVSVSENRISLEKISYLINDLAYPYNDDPTTIDEKRFKNISVENVEQKIIISYPSKKQLLVYDYSVHGLAKGTWSVWNSNKIKWDKLYEYENHLYVVSENKVYKKYPKVKTTIHQVKFPVGFYQDGGADYNMRIKTHDTSLGLLWNSIKLKRLWVSTANNINKTPDFLVEVWADQVMLEKYKVKGTYYSAAKTGKMKTGQSIVNFKSIENINSKLFIKSLPSRTLGISIMSVGDAPFEINNIKMEVLESQRKPKIKRKR